MKNFNIFNGMSKLISKIINNGGSMFIKTSYDHLDQYNKDDIKLLIRDINIEILLSELDITPKLSRLDNDTIKICRKISSKGMVIGGSVLLKACGLLDRKCDDIDVFYDVIKAIKSKLINQDNIINSSEDYDGTLLRYKIKDDELGILDIFQVSDDDDDIDDYLVDGIRFKDPLNTLEIKFSYYRQKDLIDYWYIKEKLGI